MDNINIDVKGLRNLIDNLKLVEDVRIYTKTIIRYFTELNESLKYIDKALEGYDRELINKSIKNLEDKLHYIIINMSKSNLKTRVLMTLTIFFLVIVNIIASYTITYFYLGEYSVIFIVLSMIIGVATLVGFSLNLLSVIFLLPLIPLTSLIQSIIIIFNGYVDKYLVLLICLVCCSIFILLDIIFYIFKMYRNAIFILFNFSQNIESIFSKITKIELARFSTDIQNLIKDYERIYSNEAYELIKYIEELSKMRS